MSDNKPYIMTLYHKGNGVHLTNRNTLENLYIVSSIYETDSRVKSMVSGEIQGALITSSYLLFKIRFLNVWLHSSVRYQESIFSMSHSIQKKIFKTLK